jgi:hypothetical protein
MLHPQLCVTFVAWLLRKRLLEDHYSDVALMKSYCFAFVGNHRDPVRHQQQLVAQSERLVIDRVFSVLFLINFDC